jgi:type I restriction enzyme M protein
MKDKTGRCGVLFPHGILERDAEQEMRKRIIEEDLIDCVVGLGKDLFYNSSMESCLVFCRTKKDPSKKGKILFIDARDEITRKQTQSFLEKHHIDKIFNAYKDYKDVEGFAKVVSNEEVLNNNGNLNIKLYVENHRHLNMDIMTTPLKKFVDDWKKSSKELEESTKEMNKVLKEVINGK